MALGVAGGQGHQHTGGGSNYLCLPADPIWGLYNDRAGSATVYGAEFEHSNNFLFGDKILLNNHNPPCALCHVVGRSTQFMLPGRSQCYAGWTPEYNGYLMAEHQAHHGRTEYVCMDGEPEAEDAGYDNDNGALFYPVEGKCGSLPCPPYINNRELTCVVCSK